MAADQRPVLYVLAGVNGAGKSSIGGALLRRRKLDYFNPDEFAREIRRLRQCPVQEANAEAWQHGRQLLEAAIRQGSSHAFETTLGGNSIPALLMEAAQSGHAVILWFCGLASPELHLQRVAARVRAGGHDIPAEKIHERWRNAPANLIALLPWLDELKVFDNSRERDAVTKRIPPLELLLHLRQGKVLHPDAAALARTPDWAKPVVEAALSLEDI